VNVERAIQLRPLLLGTAVGLATAIVMLATESRMAIVWDEGYTLGREARLRDWFRGLADPPRFAKEWRPLPPDRELVQMDGAQPPGPEQLDTRTKLIFNRRALEWFWPFAREEPHGHPPFYALLGLVGDVLAPSWSDLPRARLGPILLFSLTAGAIFGFVAARWGPWAAALATGSWVFQPNLFGHGHYAGYDAVLASLWVLAIFAFIGATGLGTGPKPAATRRAWALTFGLILGCAFATKLTGWFLPLPFLGWAVWYRSRPAFKTLLVGLVVGTALLFVLMPPWWSAPIDGVPRFLESNISRDKTIPTHIQFLHRTYETPRQWLPWYNTLVWTMMVTPLGFLVMGLLGLVAAVARRREEPVGLLIAGHWIFLMILRALPHTPGHDGVRLFLPAFGVLALLGGLGARSLLDRWGRWARAAIVAAVVEGIASVAVMMPVPLSYFSPIVGGLPGATALGMEPTYYWDALEAKARRWLIANTEPGRTVQFATFPTSLLYLRRMGELPRLWNPSDRDPPQWLVIQNRPGTFSDFTRILATRGHAEFTVEKLGVPLVWIFRYSEVERLALRQPR
jgi:4-amino-4-deoxy-L-arabinose transferase-like glycosyltransferase